jgi:hypothetical protein
VKPFWTTWKKIAVTILLAVIAFLLFGCSSPSPVPCDTTNEGQQTSVPFLEAQYHAYNESYFSNRLPAHVDIALDLGGDRMAETWCKDRDGQDCQIRFNMRYSAAERTSLEVLAHEMCHMKVWSKNLPQDKPEFQTQLQYDHNRIWRSCMVELDSAGLFRDIIIDNYDEEVR